MFATFFSFYFLLGSAFPQGDFAQLLHIPDALIHFNEHLTAAGDESDAFSLWTFIRDHYSDPDSHSHTDTESHESLPLQHIHASVLMIEAKYHILPQDELVYNHSREINFVHSFYTSNFKEGIYHPPIPS